ncbi:MAG: hypothetical protein JSS43_03265 [Proteobacteria bacterium]|nr:hypothetical protein [Pseudomonadota bacterium]
MAAGEPVVTSGAILAYRLFDVAYEIDLPKAEASWARTTSMQTSRSRLTTTPPKAMAFGVPPVQLGLDPITLPLAIGHREASVSARLFDFGVISLALRVPVAGQRWQDLVALLNAVEAAIGIGADGGVWETLLAQVRRGIGAALVRPATEHLAEDYLIAVVQGLEEPLTAEALQQRVDLVALLSGEQRPLADGARRDLLQHRYSYYADDLVALTWNRAFILEPRGDTDVVDVLEVANAQLLEMRYYDELLDAELPRMYDLVQETHRGRAWPGVRRYADLARRLYALVAEVTELTEKADNALQVTEDVYLARVYAAALELFRVRALSAAVDRKLSIIRDTYMSLYDEAAGSRSTVLEIIIVLLILVEVVLAFRH